MRVKNEKKFCYFEYKSEESSKISLGDVVRNSDGEVGVIIQIHDESSYRTDMFGNCDLSEIKIANICEIEEKRLDIIPELCI